MLGGNQAPPVGNPRPAENLFKVIEIVRPLNSPNVQSDNQEQKRHLEQLGSFVGDFGCTRVFMF